MKRGVSPLRDDYTNDAHAAMHMLIHMFDFQKLFSMEMFSNTPAPLVPFLFIGFFCNWYLILLVLWGVKKRLGY